ncbi:MAG: hypothetical protein AUK47_15575 [Deltaproteobacteria bacterium CG2_30_63_29]|nr:MAG: hypothetical protein AUK47_15575 [Deltaproteobacteria bacterium CG2_30_63_29]PJB43380.1 MAG: hypothetical protein CO108_10090 [Deltaproteobacteria bacterium CG_4_9_14_3_um_filter_63_12]
MGTHRFSSSLWAALVAAVVTTGFVGCAKPHSVQFAGSVPYTLHNDVEDTICSVRMAPSTLDNWGENWLSEGEGIGAGGDRTFMTLGDPDWAAEVTLCNGHIHSGNHLSVASATTTNVSALPRITSVVTVVNDSADEICSLFMAPPNSPWGNNWLAYTIPSGQESTFLVYKYDTWYLQAVMCSGRIYEGSVATLDPQRVAVLQQMADVSAVVTLINNLQADLCAVQIASTTDADWGYNWLQADTYVPAGNAWSAIVRQVDQLALRMTACDGRIWEGRGYQGVQDSTIELGWLALVYEPPPAPVYVEPTAPVYEQPTAGYTDTSSGNNGSSGSYGSSGGSTDSGGYGSGGYGSSGGGGSSNSGGSSTIAPSCSLTAAPRCDGNAVLSCQDIGGGMVAEHRQVCPLGCKNAACVYAYQLCKARFAGSGSCPSECDRSYSVSVNGNSYCTSSCGPGGECPAGTACTSDGTCLPPCSVPGDCPTGFLPYCGSSGFCGGI